MLLFPPVFCFSLHSSFVLSRCTPLLSALSFSASLWMCFCYRRLQIVSEVQADSHAYRAAQLRSSPAWGRGTPATLTQVPTQLVKGLIRAAGWQGQPPVELAAPHRIRVQKGQSFNCCVVKRHFPGTIVLVIHVASNTGRLFYGFGNSFPSAEKSKFILSLWVLGEAILRNILKHSICLEMP